MSPLRFALALLLFCLWLQPAQAAELLLLSDIHLNPIADKTLTDRLAVAPPEQWVPILDQGVERHSAYGEDSDWKLMRAAFAAMKAQPKPDAVVITGDFLAHRFRALFDATAADHSDAAFHRFTIATMGFIALQLRATFPTTPILTVLGNNDDDCGEYVLQPGGSFLADTAPIAASLAGAAGDDAFRQSWRTLGNYIVPLPGVANTSLIGLNTNFFSTHYKNACGAPSDGNPAAMSLSWLKSVLAEAEAAHRKVMLAYHIPPGVDAFSSLRSGASCPMTPVPMFAPAYGDALHAILARYRDTITASFAGHTHMDGFRLLSDNGNAFGFVLMTPGISPNVGQNPAFRRVTIDTDGGLIDQSTYYLANLPDAVLGATPQWRLEMAFDKTFGLSRIDVANLGTLSRRLGSDQATRRQWVDAYGVQGPARATVTPQNFAVYRCTAASDRSDDVARCSCAGETP